MLSIAALVAFLLHPTHLFLALLALGWGAGRLGLRRVRGVMIGGACAFIAVALATPTADALLWRLETRFDAPPPPVAAAAGAIVLGGATSSSRLGRPHAEVQLNEAADRLTTILALRAQRPDLPVVFAGGGRFLGPGDAPEAERVRRFLSAVGADPATIVFEGGSRNTFENARNTSALLGGAASGPRPWLLVTSAAHMPRAIGAFRAQGVTVAAFPTDYRQLPPRWSLSAVNAGRLERMRVALHEYVGLLGYWLLGRTDALFPVPAPAPAAANG